MNSSQMVSVDKDAFSSGQVGSKLWLCEELERLKWTSRIDIHIWWVAWDIRILIIK